RRPPKAGLGEPPAGDRASRRLGSADARRGVGPPRVRSRTQPEDRVRALDCCGRRGTKIGASRIPLYGNVVEARRVQPQSAGPAASSNSFAMGARTDNRQATPRSEEPRTAL